MVPNRAAHHIWVIQWETLPIFWPMFPFHNSLKTSDNERFSGTFRVYKREYWTELGQDKINLPNPYSYKCQKIPPPLEFIGLKMSHNSK